MIREAVLIGVATALQRYLRLKWFLFPLNILTLFILTGGWKKLRVITLTLGRDLRYLRVVFKTQQACRRNMHKTVPQVFSEICAKQPDKVALVDAESGMALTFGEAEKLANQIGNIFYNHGYRAGDCVGLLMDSSPEYPCYWMGLAKIGVITGLFNTSLKGESLAHCIKISKAKAVIYGSNFKDAVESIKDVVDDGFAYYSTSSIDAVKEEKELNQLLLNASCMVPPKPENHNMKNKLLYIFTSGTTGLPKAAVVTHLRYFFSSIGVNTAFGITTQDVTYIPLPLFHTTGAVGVIGYVLCGGNTAVIRSKFSASRFLDDCIKYNCTAVYHIGEVCRYLLSQPQRPEDRKHQLRIMVGSGLKDSMWTVFKERFNIPRIAEFYGSTEGCGVVNMDEKIGAVGFFPNILPKFLSFRLVKIDEDTRDVIRGSNGYAVDCKAGECGELIAPITRDVGRQFEGYLDKDATDKKKLHSVFRKGDAYARTGDLFQIDELGYLYFKDRTGDTFRWKGENVSTAEVETLISKVLELKDVVAYGVEIPHTDGKAGMICIADPEKQVNMEELGAKLRTILPPYAVPVFVRRSSQVDVTCSFKYKKVDLRKQGFDLDKVYPDDVYIYDCKAKCYQILSREVLSTVMEGSFRF